jgi:formylglycine-generating enzyme required for sulfatase activity
MAAIVLKVPYAVAQAYGSAGDMLGHYGWYLGNSGDTARPVGQLKPNEYGLFDQYGNTAEWCQDRYASHRLSRGGQALVDEEDAEDTFRFEDPRVLRGSSFQ